MASKRPNSPKGRKAAVDLFIDFDGTITIDDTLEALANTAYSAVPQSRLDELEIPPWSYFVDAYYEDYAEFSATQKPRVTLADEVAFRQQPALRVVEAASFDRVNASGLFNLVTPESLRTVASTVAIRPGFAKLVRESIKAGVRPRLISVNWSPKFLRAVLTGKIGSELAGEVEIYCSEIIPDSAIKPHRRDFPTRLHTADDKIRMVEGLRMAGNKTIFIGDSKTDLPAMLIVDVGIATLGDGGLIGSFAGWGMEKWDLTRENLRKHKSGEDGMFYLDDFEDVVKSGLLQGKNKQFKPKRQA